VWYRTDADDRRRAAEVIVHIAHMYFNARLAEAPIGESSARGD
jgi:hypothetical protein